MDNEAATAAEENGRADSKSEEKRLDERARARDRPRERQRQHPNQARKLSGVCALLVGRGANTLAHITVA